MAQQRALCAYEKDQVLMSFHSHSKCESHASYEVHALRWHPPDSEVMKLIHHWQGGTFLQSVLTDLHLSTHFSLSALFAAKGYIWEMNDGWGGGVPCGAQGTVKVLPGALPQRSPNAFIVWACPQLQIHDHLSLRSKSSHVPHVKKSKQNSQGLLILAELLLTREKFC